jgi:predicted anti-sigma-YlaC factor YlaD
LDHEQAVAPLALVEEHLRACAACRAFAAGAAQLTPLIAREAGALPAPDLTAAILARINAEAPRRVKAGWDRAGDARVGLAVLGVLQLVLALPALLGQSVGTPVHALHELASFDIAIAVGLLVAALRPQAALGLLPVMATLTALLAGTSVFDVLSGHAQATGETFHLVEVVGVGLLWLVRRPTAPSARSSAAPTTHA